MAEFVWTPFAIPRILALVASVARAIAIYAAAPQRTQNRFLALFLIFAVWPLVASDAETWSLRGVEFSFEISAGLLYLAFVGTIDSPLSRPFRSAIARGIILVGVAAPEPAAAPFAHALAPLECRPTWRQFGNGFRYAQKRVLPE